MWIPRYLQPKGDGTVIGVEADWIRVNECPVSVMSRHAEIDVLVEEICWADETRQRTGVFPGGPDPFKWSCRWSDCVEIFSLEERTLDAAIHKAMR